LKRKVTIFTKDVPERAIEAVVEILKSKQFKRLGLTNRDLAEGLIEVDKKLNKKYGENK